MTVYSPYLKYIGINWITLFIKRHFWTNKKTQIVQIYFHFKMKVMIVMCTIILHQFFLKLRFFLFCIYFSKPCFISFLVSCCCIKALNIFKKFILCFIPLVQVLLYFHCFIFYFCSLITPISPSRNDYIIHIPNGGLKGRVG